MVHLTIQCTLCIDKAAMRDGLLQHCSYGTLVRCLAE